MIEFVHGDMFDTPADIRVNTVNCVGVMGAGVALAFKHRYPEMYRDYQRDCKNGQVKPGKMHIWKSIEGAWIVNFPTKRHWRESSRYDDVEDGLTDFRKYLDEVGPVTVTLPALGCGHGGLDWERVSKMIQDKLDGVNAMVYVFAPAASHLAGKTKAPLTDNDIYVASQLGYYEFRGTDFINFEKLSSLFVMGSPAVMSRKWIALLPSQNPEERELRALHAISKELVRHDSSICVALILRKNVSVDIAKVFAGNSVNTAILMPFGVATRQTFAKNLLREKSHTLTIISNAAPEAKWTRHLENQANMILRENASVILISDPDPNWVTNKRNLTGNKNLPIFHVKYEAASELINEKFSSIGAISIGRKSEDGSPNIDSILTYGSSLEPSQISTDSIKTGISEIQFTEKSDYDENASLKIKITAMSKHQRQLLFDKLCELEIIDMSISIRRRDSDEIARILSDFGILGS